MPFVMQVARGYARRVKIFGDDYDTPDGTGVRDYIHVCDLAEGHVAAVNALASIDSSKAINLGTRVGSSVLDVLACFRTGRRPEDSFAGRWTPRW